MNIKAFVFVFVICSLYDLVVLQSASEVAAYKEKQQACIKELKIADAEAAQLASDKELSNPSEAQKCFYSCLYKKLNLLTADGKPNHDALLKFAQMRFLKAPVEKIKSQFGICTVATKKDASACEFIYSYEQCMVKALGA